VGQIVARVFELENASGFISIIQADDADRLELLRSILGEKEAPNLEELRLELKTDDAPFTPITISSPGSTETVSNPTDVPPSQDELEDSKKNEPATTDTPHPISGTNIAVTIEKVDPSPPKKLREIVRRKEGVHTIEGGSRRVTNWKRCEDLAVAFEEFENRFPVKVSNILGYKGPKCDVLSFVSEEDRELFRDSSSSQKDINAVERFIEVKGSINEKGAIDLKGNELVAAHKYKKKYYLYRMYEKSPNEYYVLLLCNPLEHKEALEEIWTVVPERAQKASRYHIDIGMQDPLIELRTDVANAS
jgi:hypothetical protein